MSWGIDIQRYPANFEQKIDYFISNRDYRSAVSHMRIYLEHMLCYRVEFKVETKVKKWSICKPSLDHVRQKVCKQWRDEDSLRGKDELMHMNKLLLLDKIKDENSNWKILNQENHLLDIESPYYLQTKDIKETELRDLYQLLKQLYQELT